MLAHEGMHVETPLIVLADHLAVDLSPDRVHDETLLVKPFRPENRAVASNQRFVEIKNHQLRRKL